MNQIVCKQHRSLQQLAKQQLLVETSAWKQDCIDSQAEGRKSHPSCTPEGHANAVCKYAMPETSLRLKHLPPHGSQVSAYAVGIMQSCTTH